MFKVNSKVTKMTSLLLTLNMFHISYTGKCLLKLYKIYVYLEISWNKVYFGRNLISIQAFSFTIKFKS